MKQCYFCEKKSINGGTRILLRGNYNPTNRTRKQPNLQWLKNPTGNGRVKACVKCIKTITKKGK
ncbi:MAG: hypothetical protein KGI50_02445 [Patescibacteria group bacterium]|nr:hypothetical protein [Patescibacteria group bacterium]MDE2437794.1 hypothetical protein [Patescibacteria group bacterium]